MAEKTEVVYARLTRGFPQSSVRRRAGFIFNSGQQPQKLEVNETQLRELSQDSYIELVDEAEFDKFNKSVEDTADETSTENDDDGGDDTGSGRDYDDDSEGGSIGSGDEPKPITTDLKLAELVAVARAEKVPGSEAETFGKPGTAKQAVVDAILENRNKTEE